MTDVIKPEVIKKTQDLLGKYFKKPPLTEKLLKKPPFRFLHDIISAVITETGFLDGLFTEEELNSDNIKDKEAKLAYLTKLVDVVKLISGSNLTVRPSKIISGQEPTKTNELLQAIGKALDKKVSSTEAIQHYKKSLEKKAKSTSRRKSSTSKDESLTTSRQASQTRKPLEKDKSTEQKRRSSSTSKVTATEKERREDTKQGKGHTVEKTTDGNEKIYKITENIEVPPAEPLQDKIPASAQRKKHSTSPKPKQNVVPSPSELAQADLLQTKLSVDKKTEEHTRRKDSASKTKRLLQNQSSESQNQVPNTVDARFSESTSGNSAESANIEQTNQVIENQENGILVDNESSPEHIEKTDSPASESHKIQSEDTDVSASQQIVSGARTSLRPPSARPPSARPAAPRMKAKTELIVNEEILTPMGNISVIIENSDIKEDDDAEDMVVMETRGGDSDSLDNNSTYKIHDQLTQEHGHLVAQILETQRDLVNNENVDVIPKKTDIAWDTGSRRNREVVTKEIDKLRSTIQTLTRATNPLGKLLDYLQEDVEMMQKELLEWRNQYSQLNEQLKKEKMQTQELIEPMKEALKEIDYNMKIQLDKICQAKSQIIKNDQKIQTLLNGRL